MDQRRAWMNPVVLDFPICEGVNVAGEYEGFIINLREALADHPHREYYVRRYGDWLRRHPLLPVQRAIQPARWIHINIIVQDENRVEKERTTIAVRDDNLYFQGFKNQNGRWYEFGEEGKSVHFFAGSTLLGCSVGYPDLVGDAANLVGLSLTKYHLIDAVRRLSVYQEVVPAGRDTRHDLARICIMICESARMIPHRAAVSDRWNGNDQIVLSPSLQKEIGLSLEEAENIKDWTKMSKELLKDPNPLDNSYIKVVHLLRNAAGSRSQQQDQQPQTSGGGGSRHHDQGQGSSSQTQRPSSWRPATGSDGGSGAQGQTGGKSVRTRPLLELFKVSVVKRSDLPVISTITLFDGKRGQIIYKHRRGQNLYQDIAFDQLALNGPYKAISAEGSFAIQLYDGPSTESSQVVGEMFCDCNTTNVKYNEVLTGRIISTGTLHGTLVKVAYAVWSDAVEATIEVNLLLPRISYVHGAIIAGYGNETLERGHYIQLFSRLSDERVELVPSSGDSTVSLQLGRSVLAVPVLSRYTRVTINLYLYLEIDLPPTEDEDEEYEGYETFDGCIDFYIDKQTGEIRTSLKRSKDNFLPVGWDGVSDSAGSHGASTSASHQMTDETSKVKVQVNITSPGFSVSPVELDHNEVIERDHCYRTT